MNGDTIDYHLAQIHTKMKIVPVDTFDDALNYLKSHY